MLISLVAERLEHLGRDARMASHAGADDRDLADVGLGLDAAGDFERLEHVGRRGQVLVGDGEGEVGCPIGRDGLVLDDHVDVDVRVGKSGEDAAGDAGLVAEPGQGHARLVGVGHGCHASVAPRSLPRRRRAYRGLVERTAAVDPDAVVSPVLDRAQLQHPRTRGRHLEHLVERDHRQLARVGDEAGIGAEDPGDIGVDLADVGAERGGNRYRGRVRSPTAERGHVPAVARDPLKAGDEHDPVVVERGPDAVGANVEDARLRVRGVGDDAGLRTGERDRAVTDVVDCHRA